MAIRPNSCARTLYPLAAALVLVVRTASAGEAEDQYAVAAGHYAAQRWQLAVDEFRALIKQHPDDANGIKAHFFLGEALVQLGKYNEATGEFQQVLARDANGPLARQAAFRSGETAYLSGQGETARRALEAFRAKYPDDKLNDRVVAYLDEIELSAVESLMAAKRFSDAEDKLQAFLKSRPTAKHADRAMGQLAVCQLQLGENDKAAETFALLLSRFPTSPAAAEAAWSRGQVLERLSKFDAALASYQVVIDHHANSPRFDDATLGAARLHNQLRQFDQAIELYHRLLRDQAKSSQADAARYGLAWALRDSGKRSEADEQFQTLHDSFRQSRYWNDSTFRLAESAFEQKQLDKADRLLEELLTAKPPAEVREHALYLQGQVAATEQTWGRVAETMNRLSHDFPNSTLRFPAEYWTAEAAYRQGQYEEAGKRFAALASQLGGRHETWLPMIPLRQAQSLAQQKQWAEAQAVAARIEADWPEFSEQYEADYLQGRALATQANFDGARKSFQKVIRSPTGGKSETAAMAQWMIGETYFHQENYEAALHEYLRVEILYAYPRWQAAALLQAGKCQEALGHWQDATELYGRLIKAYPKTEFTDEAKRRLHDAENHVTAGAASTTNK
jgi:TolA-binding protein